MEIGKIRSWLRPSQEPVPARSPDPAPVPQAAVALLDAKTILPAAYRRYRFQDASEVIVEIPEAEGVDVYVFAGPTMRAAVQRYNLFSGGGALPPRWGLGVWYRVKGDFNQDETLKLASEFRDRRIPCDVIGLEPGWQTHAYSCTYVWSKSFPGPAGMAKQLASKSYRLNLWEHAFTHPDSPIHDPLVPHRTDSTPTRPKGSKRDAMTVKSAAR